MNSEKQLYEELLKEHPELKESKIDILEVITLMKQVNPDIVADADYKASLKERLDTIAEYNPQKSNGIFGFLKYFIPVFSFGFAVFGFVYFSGDFKSKTFIETGSIESIDVYQEESENIAPAEMMMLSDMADEDILEKSTKELQRKEYSNFSDNLIDYGPSDSEIEIDMVEVVGLAKQGMQDESISITNIKFKNLDKPEQNNIQAEVVGVSIEDEDNIPEDILEESMSMMFSMDSMMEDSTMNEDIPESEAVESMGIMEIQEEGEMLDIFLSICGEYNGLIKVLKDGDRTCVLENRNCLESTYTETECFNIK